MSFITDNVCSFPDVYNWFFVMIKLINKKEKGKERNR